MSAELVIYGKINLPVGRLTPYAWENQEATACPGSTDLSREPRQRRVVAAGQDCTELAANSLSRTDFSSLQHFLQEDDDQCKLHQLSEWLADRCYQYHVYRADWLGGCSGHFVRSCDYHRRMVL